VICIEVVSVMIVVIGIEVAVAVGVVIACRQVGWWICGEMPLLPPWPDEYYLKQASCGCGKRQAWQIKPRAQPVRLVEPSMNGHDDLLRTLDAETIIYICAPSYHDICITHMICIHTIYGCVNNPSPT
jgi:hypothetical protein